MSFNAAVIPVWALHENQSSFEEPKSLTHGFSSNTWNCIESAVHAAIIQATDTLHTHIRRPLRVSLTVNEGCSDPLWVSVSEEVQFAEHCFTFFLQNRCHFVVTIHRHVALEIVHSTDH